MPARILISFDLETCLSVYLCVGGYLYFAVPSASSKVWNAESIFHHCYLFKCAFTITTSREGFWTSFDLETCLSMYVSVCVCVCVGWGWIAIFFSAISFFTSVKCRWATSWRLLLPVQVCFHYFCCQGRILISFDLETCLSVYLCVGGYLYFAVPSASSKVWNAESIFHHCYLFKCAFTITTSREGFWTSFDLETCLSMYVSVCVCVCVGWGWIAIFFSAISFFTSVKCRWATSWRLLLPVQVCFHYFCCQGRILISFDFYPKETCLCVWWASVNFALPLSFSNVWNADEPFPDGCCNLLRCALITISTKKECLPQAIRASIPLVIHQPLIHILPSCRKISPQLTS